MIIQEAQSDGLLLPIYHSCLALNVSRSGYYEWLKRSEKLTAENSESSDLVNQIQEIALDKVMITFSLEIKSLAVSSKAINLKN